MKFSLHRFQVLFLKNRFMYTGRLDLKEGTYKKMYETAQTLQMSVLTKLMDAQVNGVSVGPENRKPVKRSNGVFDDDPVEQIRKIRKIEKQVAQEERKRVVTARTKQEELARLPGKKLPIWKRRTPETLAKPDQQMAAAEEQKLHSVSRAAGPSGYRIPRVGEEAAEANRTMGSNLPDHHLEHQQHEDGQLIPPPLVSTTYRKRSPGEKPKIPRRLQEIQQHLMFEKILKTGTKNTVAKPTEPEEPKTGGDLSLEEVKALVEEQKQRMAATTQDEEEEEDYYDESVGLGDDFIDADVDSPAPAETIPEPAIQAGPIPEPEAQKKSVRFSLRPNPRPGLSTSEPSPVEAQPDAGEPEVLPDIPVSNSENLAVESNEAIDMAINVPQAATSQEEQTAKQQISLTLPEPGPKVEEGIQTELDEALEEFSRVAEEEEAEEMRVEGKGLDEDGARKQDHTKPRRGRPPRWLKEQTLQMGEIARKKEEQAGPVADQAQVINEVMKKYPNLFKDNKQV